MAAETFFLPDLPLVRYSQRTVSGLPARKKSHWDQLLKVLSELESKGIRVFLVPQPEVVDDVDYRTEYVQEVLGAKDYFKHPNLLVLFRVDKHGHMLENQKIYIYHDHIVEKKTVSVYEIKKNKRVVEPPRRPVMELVRRPNPLYDFGARKQLVLDAFQGYKWFTWNGTDAKSMIVLL